MRTHITSAAAIEREIAYPLAPGVYKMRNHDIAVINPNTKQALVIMAENLIKKETVKNENK